MRFFPVFLLFGLAAAPVAAVEVSTRASYLWTENLGRASGPVDFRDAATYEAGVTVGTSRQFESGLLLRPQFQADYSFTPEYDLLDAGEFGPNLAVQKKFGLGPTAPTLIGEVAVLGRVGRLDESEAVIGKVSLTFNKRFNSLFSVSVRGEMQEDWARGDVYDVGTQRISGTVFFDPHPKLRFSAGAGRLSGTFVAGASAARFAGALGGALGPEVANYYANTPFSTTDIFAPGWVSYRVHGEVDFWFFDVSPAITDNTSLSVRYERVSAINKVDVRYYQDILRVALIHVF